jgi:hypothetical protein
MAQIIVDDLGEIPNGLVMYAEIAGRRIDCVIYRDAGDKIVHRPCPAPLLSKIRLARRMQEADKRWCGIRYDIENDHFSAKMTYPEEIRAHETFDDRRTRLEITTFGRKTLDDDLMER